MILINKLTIIIFCILFLFSCNKITETKENSKIINKSNSGSGAIKIKDKKEDKFLGAGYYRKKDGIYYFDEKIKNADRETFLLLNDPIWSEYGIDKDNAFGFGNFLKNSDKKTFEVLSFRYAKDKDNVYCFGEKLLGADSSSFINTPEMDTYAKDNDNVYFNCDIIKDIDNKTFQVLRGGEGVAKDKNNIYCGYEAVDRIDRDSYTEFYIESKRRGEMLSEYSKDKNNVYYSCNHIIKPADSESFEPINPFFAKDKNHVYKYNKILNGVDPNNYTMQELEDKMNDF